MNYQERARRITREAGVPNHASLYPRIIEHVADAIASVERETARRCAEIAAAYSKWEGGGIAEEIQKEFGLS